ncbi:DUF3014 domain-containing protein [Rhodanobacter sp. DHG33]|uniref:DUF3014 domain-containing protein n=1 Tax=Rhodanobacter sp. DHG33 TaxID=2775921 RepID=UPI0017853E44|nr:DUF3014 domain-containing protein [Rhodanobacter sp. DHG33]MBD8900050.1 DUF3014 domain-containing protein [Rhodanobacter sp. DHG33]
MANRRERDISDWIPVVIVVALVVAGGVYVAHRFMQPGAEPAAASTAAAPASPAMPSAVTHHPIAQAEVPASTSTAPLPALDGSDASVGAGLRALGGDRLQDLLSPRQIVNHIVATVDALPRHELGSASILPLRTPRGAFMASETQGTLVADPRNTERYAPYMAVVRRADSSALVAWYVHNYPLFQQAYRELGYPKGYFNDRLIAAIDDMLAAPQLPQAPALRLANGRYTYADPALESLSVGQKLMLRLGPANEAELKVKLRVIRGLLTVRPSLTGPREG